MKILNSLTKRKEQFEPKNENEVKIYACGITVNGDAHLGHARQAIIFDMIASYLSYLGYKVCYARNYTDIDDRLIEQAKKAGVDALKLADQRIGETEELIGAITTRQPDLSPRVSQSMGAIIAFIQGLIQKGFAYESSGDVYFDVNAFADYGKLTNRNLEQLLESVRIERSENKRYPLDFALWKMACEDEMGFASPFGRGRPGWHIECSAMIQQLFGGYVDIHGGGLDLKFPHHENEIAQSEAYNGFELAKYWLHNGLVTVDGQKMSKSLDNFITLKELLQRYDGEVIRLVTLSNHYTSSLEMGEEAIATAQKNLYYFYKSMQKCKNALASTTIAPTYSPVLIEDFESSMSDDFNTAGFIAHLYTAFSTVNSLKLKNKQDIDFVFSLLKDIERLGGILGFLVSEPTEYIERLRARSLKSLDIKREEIEQKILFRQQKKAERDFAAADAIRAELLAQGIILNDTPNGAEWDLKSLF